MGPIRAVQIEASCLSDEQGPFEDVAPALAELEQMGIKLLPPGSMIGTPGEILYVTGTKEGILHAKSRGLVPILLMHDPDEAMKLTKLEPGGGIVSLLELPDLIRLADARRR